MSLLSLEVGFSWIFTLRRGTCIAALVVAYAYKEVCPIGWVFQPLPSFLSLLTLGAQEATVVHDFPFVLIILMGGNWFFLFLV